MDITVARNHASETAAQKSFSALQSSILNTYGLRSPSPPVVHCRNATQTSVVLEWEPLSLATAEIRSLSLYRNGSKAGNIPRPLENTTTKISGLAIDTEYVFHLVLRTSAGVYTSEKLPVRTHKMTELSGIVVTPGVMAAPLRESLAGAVERIGARIVDTVRIDTTHFVCMEGRGREWETALEQNIPVVRPEWVEGCEREGRLVGVRGYYLNADPKQRQVGQGVGLQQQHQRPISQQVHNDSQASLQRTVPSHQSSRSQQATRTISPRPENMPTSPSAEDSRPQPPAKDVPRHIQVKEEEEDGISEPATISTVTSPQQEPKEIKTNTKEDSDGSRTPGEGNFDEVTL